MPSFGNYYNEYTDNPSPIGAERFQQKLPPPTSGDQDNRIFSSLSTSRISTWSKYLWISLIICACICFFIATIVPLVIVLKTTTQIQSGG